MFRFALLIAIGAGTAPAVLENVRAQEAPPALFTAEQAARGEQVFMERCTGCHDPSLQDGGHGPGLAGDGFWVNWGGKPARPLYGRIISTMPVDAPGSLTPPDTLALVAFILRANGYPAGEKPLKTSADLDGVTLQRLKK